MRLDVALERRGVRLREARRQHLARNILRSMVGSTRYTTEAAIYREVSEKMQDLMSDPEFPTLDEKEWRRIVSGFVLPLLISGVEYFQRNSKRADMMQGDCEALRAVASRLVGYQPRSRRAGEGRDALLALVEQLPILTAEGEQGWSLFNQVVTEFAANCLPLLACMRMKGQRVTLRPRLVATAREGAACD